MITTISNSILSAQINHKGAELVSLHNQKTKREYIWEGNPEYWGKHSPILFPIVGTLKNNSYQFLDKVYELPRHGFARDLEFILIEQHNDKVVFSLQHNSKTLAVYPFEFELQLIYELQNTTLTLTYKVLNKSLKSMPFCLGGHPAFSLPIPFENYSLAFEKEEKPVSYTLENDLLSASTKQIELENQQLALSYSLFENDALVFKSMQSKQIKILENAIPILNFRFDDFPHFGVWTKINAPFICLEPWLGYADTTETSGNILEKEGIQLLEQKSAKQFSFSIEII